MAPRPYSFQGRANPKPSPKPRRPRTPRKPTTAERWASQGKTTARVMQDRPAPAKKVYGPPAPKPKAKVIYGPPKPIRTPRKPTAAQKVTAKARDRTRALEAKTEHKKAYDPKVVAALEVSRQTREVSDRLEQARRTAPDYQRKILGVPLGKSTKARDVIADSSARPLNAPKGALKLSETVTAKGKTPGELAELNRILKGDREDVVKRLEDWSHKTAAGKQRQKQMSTGSAKAAAKVLDYTIRPTYAIAGAGGAVIHGKNPAKAAARGLTGKDKRLWSHNLRDLGVPKGVAGPAGLVLDVATDPTTYVTAGTGSVAAAGRLEGRPGRRQDRGEARRRRRRPRQRRGRRARPRRRPQPHGRTAGGQGGRREGRRRPARTDPAARRARR